MIFVAIVVFIIVMVVAVPKFVQTFAELGTDLPWITKGMIAVSNFMTKQWLLLILIILGTALGFTSMKHSVKGKEMLDSFSLLKSPLRRLHSMSAMAQYSATMSTMLACFVGFLVFSVVLLVMVAMDLTALPRWACLLNLLVLFAVMAPFRIVGTLNIAGALMLAGLCILL